jgi:zinc protease
VLGIEKVGARSAYTLEFSPEKRLTSKMYFDVDTGLMIREDDVIHRDDGDYKVQTLLDDYRLVDGAYFPFRIKHTEKGNVFTVKVTQIKHNVPVEETVFLKPESAKK